jgi:CheY-like chemotaxis protein
MDVQMPELNGLDATRRIRESDDPIVRDVTIVALTANAMEGDEEMCLNAGMDDYLTKPITQKMLASTLDRWLETAHLSAA